MIQAADVLKINCHFASEVLKYLTKEKYVVEVSLDDIVAAYKDTVLAGLLSTCLEYEDECRLLKKVTKYPTPETPTPDIIPCDQQVPTQLTYTTNTCTYTAGLTSPIPGSAFPLVNLQNDTIYQTATVNVVVSDSCGTPTTYPIQTGYNAGGPNDLLKLWTGITWSLDNVFKSAANPYIANIGIYTTGSDGIFNSTPTYYAVAPTDVPTWTSCPTCEAIAAPDLYLNSPNFGTAFPKLMKNISKTVHSGGVYLDISVVPSANNGWKFTSLTKHNPASYWMGFNIQDFKIQWRPNGVSGPSVTKAYTPYNDIQIVQSSSQMYSSFTHSSTCGNLPILVSSNSLGANVSTSTNFYKLVLNSNYLTSVPSLTFNNITCSNSFNLMATYDSSLVSSVSWIDPNDNVLSTTSTALTSQPGLHTFNVVSLDGCFIENYINVQ